MERPHYHGHRKRLRERFLKNGLAGFAEHEVIELLLTLAIPRSDVKQPAKALLKRFGSLREVLDNVERDPDDLEQAARMDLETRAIDFILSIEPDWKRTPIANPGFDLFETGPDGRPARWCEVKAMTGSLGDRPVGVSSKQFECAREHGTSYWLYVVEHAGDEKCPACQDPGPGG